jgi:hypothetical protein
MATFVLAYRTPTNYRPGSADAMATWNAWFENTGANLVDRGNPVFTSRALGNCGANTTLGGYSLVTADNLEEAVAVAKGCPFLADGGGVEVGEITVVNRGTQLAEENFVAGR